MINYATITAFEHEFKKLLKKYPSLEKDFATLRRAVIELYHVKNINPNAIFPIPGVGADGKYMAIKVKKFACQYLKGKGANTGLRLIYVYDPAKEQVTFLEIYCKADKANEDRARIKDFIKHISEK